MKKGFTLIDVLVGAALMLIVFLGILGVYSHHIPRMDFYGIIK